MEPEQRKRTGQARACSVANCENTYYAKGLCHGHYMKGWKEKQKIKQGWVRKVPQRLQACSFEGCEKRAITKQLCKGHYTQHRQGKELTPLREYGVSFRDENGRVCNECREYKTWEDFYENVNGTRRARCKKCISSTNNKRNKERTRTW